MITPISGDKISSQQTERGPQEKRANNGSERPSPQTVQSNDDSISVSDSGKVLSETASATRVSDQIETPAQASDLAAKIRQQFEEAGSSALGLHNLDHSKAADLLAFSHG